MGSIGPLEIVIIIAVALLLFGGSRIANLGKGLGEGIKNFKKGLKDDEEAPPPKQLPDKSAKSEKKVEAEAEEEAEALNVGDEKKRG